MKNKKKKICIFSGKRGGFGAFLPLMQLIEQDRNLELQIILSDMHLSKIFGKTINEVRRYFPHTTIATARMPWQSDKIESRAKNLGYVGIEFAKILKHLAPNIVFVHADRGEHLMMALTALHLNIPIAHTQGGEITGNIDNAIRYAITKLSHLHFPETKDARQRIIATGEEPWRVHNVGSLYVDRIIKEMYPKFIITAPKYNLGQNEQFFLMLLHPETYLSPPENLAMAKAVVEAITAFNRTIIIIYPCSDPGYSIITNYITHARKKYQGRIFVYKNIENLDFLSLMSRAELMIGNSSSGFVEAPYFHLPVVNIGTRETHRTNDVNILNTPPDRISIKNAINYALKNATFRAGLKTSGHLLGNGRASEKILKLTKHFLHLNPKKLLIKKII